MREQIKTNIDGDTIRFSDGFRELLAIRETYSTQEQAARMELSGQLTSQLCFDLTDEMLLFLTCGMKLTLDFAELTYFSSTCQNAVIEIANRKKNYKLPGSFEIINVPEEIYSDLRKHHFTLVIKTSMKGGKAG